MSQTSGVGGFCTVWGPWGLSGGQAYAVGQQAGSWQSEALGPSFLSIGVRAKRPGLGKATETSLKAALGRGGRPQGGWQHEEGHSRILKAWGPPHATLGIPRAGPPGSGAPGWGSGGPHHSRNLHL